MLGWLSYSLLGMSQPEHSALLTRAAKATLMPLGFRQKGRSRVWLGDRGYWLCVVEFQPSGFSKGSYLNTSAHWLWRPSDALSFDYQLPDMQRPFISFESIEQFEPLAAELAVLAASESKRLDDQFSSFKDVARLLVEQHERVAEMPHHPPASWPALHAAIATGVLGQAATASALLEAFSKGPSAELVGPWAQSANKALAEGTFVEFIKRSIDEARAGYGLPPWRGTFTASVS